MTDPRVPVTPGIPETDNPAVSPPTEPQQDLSPEGHKTDIPSGNEVLSGEDGIACTQEFLSRIFGSDFESFRQAWQIKKG